MDRIKQIDEEIAKIYHTISEKDKKWDFSRPYNEYGNYLKPEWDKINKLDREKRVTMPYELEDIPTYGDRMTLKDFIECVKDGGFIDYDGSGNYVIDNKMTDITIYPSDVKHKAIRTEFTEIIWFNK